MSKINNGGNAFPTNTSGHIREGLSKREWYAGMAMQGIIRGGNWGIDLISEQSFNVADAMIKHEENESHE